MFIITTKNSLNKAIANAVGDIYNSALDRVKENLNGIRSVVDLSATVEKLRKELEVLSIEKSRKTEEFEKRERELTHKIGLEKLRQEQELALAKREATLEVRQANLDADKTRFEQQMKFNQDRFEGEVKAQRDMIQSLIEKLPTASMMLNRKELVKNES